MKEFNSLADEVRYYAKEYLQDGEEHAAKEIKEYVKKKMTQNVTDGAFAGAMRDLILKEHEYAVVRRGIYKFIGHRFGSNDRKKRTVDENLIDLSVSIIDEAVNEVTRKVNDQVDIFELEINKLEQIQEVKAFVQEIQSVIKKFKNK